MFISLQLTGNPLPQLGLFSETESGTPLLVKLDQTITDLGFTQYTATAPHPMNARGGNRGVAIEDGLVYQLSADQVDRLCAENRRFGYFFGPVGDEPEPKPLMLTCVFFDLRHTWWLGRVPEGPLKDYYRVPFARPAADSRSVDYAALDFETTGLGERKDEILSISFVVIRGHALGMGEGRHYLVRPSGRIPEASAVVHGICSQLWTDGRAISKSSAGAEATQSLEARPPITADARGLQVGNAGSYNAGEGSTNGSSRHWSRGGGRRLAGPM